MNSPSELQLTSADSKPQFVVKRYAKRQKDSVETLVDPILLDGSDALSVVAPASCSLDSNEWLVVSPSKSCGSSSHPCAKALTTAHNGWDLNNMSAGYRTSAPPLPKLGGLPNPVFRKPAPQIRNPSQGSHPYRAPPVRSRLFSPGFAALNPSKSESMGDVFDSATLDLPIDVPHVQTSLGLQPSVDNKNF